MSMIIYFQIRIIFPLNAFPTDTIINGQKEFWTKRGVGGARTGLMHQKLYFSGKAETVQGVRDKRSLLALPPILLVTYNQRSHHFTFF